MKRCLKFTLCLALASILIGCGSTNMVSPKGNYDIIVEMDDSRKNRLGSYSPLEVHLVALNRINASTFQNYSMTDYWDPQQADRFVYRKYAMKFGEGEPPTKTLRRDDPIWAKWAKEQEGVSMEDMHLFVLADFRGRNFEDKPGKEDVRRLVAPLAHSYWKDARTIRINVKREGIVYQLPRK